ncbi:MAG: tRNA (adenine-N(6)-)-methyltransferase [Clostridia bacterium]|nr:tRNA (adenine-N(6)-)-methyltransferase [Clostridia bacterium]
MNSSKLLYSNGKNDECYTPRYAVLPIIKYLPKDKIIWCPFDTEQSEFVKVFKENGFNVINSHINYGQDFYNYEPQNWDIIVSNPPFTNKRKIFERCLAFNKPFALLMSNTWLNDSAPKQLFKHKDLQLLMFEQRVQYNNLNKITFSSSYYCWNVLPKQIIMEKLKKGEIEI